MLIEVCANSLQSALNAEKGGAHRIELCSELAVGGVTPSYGLLKAVRERISIPVHVLVRPRSSDFTYSEDEFKIILSDIETCVDLGFDGIVSGALRKDNSLDDIRTKQLINASKHLSFTFHRAFDWVRDPIKTFKTLAELGVQTILSSGQKPTAVQGILLLQELQLLKLPTKIMPGGGINLNNIQDFKKLDFTAVHFSASRLQLTLEAAPTIQMNALKFLRDDAISVSDVEVIQQIVNVVK